MTRPQSPRSSAKTPAKHEVKTGLKYGRHNEDVQLHTNIAQFSATCSVHSKLTKVRIFHTERTTVGQEIRDT